MRIQSRTAARGIACLILPLTAALVAGCSSSGTGSGASNTPAGTTAAAGTSAAAAGDSSCVSGADKFMQSYASLPTKLASQYTPLSKAPKSGGLLIKIAKGSVPADIASAKTEAVAAKSIGWTEKTISYDGSVTGFNTAFDQAVAEHPTVISSAAPVPDPSVITGLAAAKKAGIVVSLSSMQQAPTSYPGYAAGSQGPDTFTTIASIMANYALKDSGCKVHAAIVPLTGITALENEAADTKKDITSVCSSCSATIVPVSPTDLGSPAVATAITSALQADPSINYLILTLGNIADGLDVSLKQAGISSVKIIGGVPDATNIKALQDKTNAMWVNLSVDMNGFTELDAALRAIDSGKPFSGLPFPLSVLTPENVGTGSGLPTQPTDYQAEFEKLWHVG